MNVASLTERIERRDRAHWDREARRLGFKDFAQLEAAESAAFDAAWTEMENNCTHPDKIEDINVCEQCAAGFRA